LDKKRLLAVWVDALRSDYVTKEKMPFLSDLLTNSIVCEYRPLLGFTGIGASVVTGLSPPKHGIWVEFMYDRVESIFRWLAAVRPAAELLDRLESSNHTGWGLRTYLEHACFKVSGLVYRNRYKPIAHNIPFSLLPMFTTSLKSDIFWERFHSPTLGSLLQDNKIDYTILSDADMHDHQILKIGLKRISRSRLLLLQLSSLDAAGHNLGPSSDEIIPCLRRLDSQIRAFVTSVSAWNAVDVMIFTDHGMNVVNKICNLTGPIDRGGLKLGVDYLAFLDSTMGRFWSLSDGATQKLIQILSTIEGGRVLERRDYVKYLIPTDIRYGEIVWLANPGNLILPNFYQGRRVARGMHGYIPESPEQKCHLMISGENLRKGRLRHVSAPMDILPTILDLLDLQIPQGLDGISLLRAR
jgi:predicted AlkP superfamily pyrophosphatase or phosphodiesterase